MHRLLVLFLLFVGCADSSPEKARSLASLSNAGSGAFAKSGFSIGTQSWYFVPWSGEKHFDSLNPVVWNPQFLADLKPYSTLRFMDATATNFSHIRSWSERRLPTDPGNDNLDNSEGQSIPGLAYELVADLCNKTQKDCWINVPAEADDNYVEELARLFKYRLSPRLKLYVEYSNETANGAFPAFGYVIQKGQELGLPGSNKYYQGSAYAVLRTLQISRVFHDQFGASRVRVVFAYMGNLDLGTQALKNVYKNPVWNPSGAKIDMLAVAPYFGFGDGSQATLDGLKAEIDSMLVGEPIGIAERDQKAYGIPLLGAYESGSSYSQNAGAFAKNPLSGDVYRYAYERFSERMNGPCLHYVSVGTWTSKSAWGALDHTGQPVSESPRAQALMDVINEL